MGKPIVERNLTIEELGKATAIFITNAISGIKWVRQFGDSQFDPSKIIPIYNEMIKTIYSL